MQRAEPRLCSGHVMTEWCQAVAHQKVSLHHNDSTPLPTYSPFHFNDLQAHIPITKVCLGSALLAQEHQWKHNLHIARIMCQLLCLNVMLEEKKMEFSCRQTDRPASSPPSAAWLHRRVSWTFKQIYSWPWQSWTEGLPTPMHLTFFLSVTNLLGCSGVRNWFIICCQSSAQPRLRALQGAATGCLTLLSVNIRLRLAAETLRILNYLVILYFKYFS